MKPIHRYLSRSIQHLRPLFIDKMDSTFAAGFEMASAKRPLSQEEEPSRQGTPKRLCPSSPNPSIVSFDNDANIQMTDRCHSSNPASPGHVERREAADPRDVYHALDIHNFSRQPDPFREDEMARYAAAVQEEDEVLDTHPGFYGDACLDGANLSGSASSGSASPDSVGYPSFASPLGAACLTGANPSGSASPHGAVDGANLSGSASPLVSPSRRSSQNSEEYPISSSARSALLRVGFRSSLAQNVHSNKEIENFLSSSPSSSHLRELDNAVRRDSENGSIDLLKSSFPSSALSRLDETAAAVRRDSESGSDDFLRSSFSSSALERLDETAAVARPVASLSKARQVESVAGPTTTRTSRSMVISCSGSREHSPVAPSRSELSRKVVPALAAPVLSSNGKGKGRATAVAHDLSLKTILVEMYSSLYGYVASDEYDASDEDLVFLDTLLPADLADIVIAGMNPDTVELMGQGQPWDAEDLVATLIERDLAMGKHGDYLGFLRRSDGRPINYAGSSQRHHVHGIVIRLREHLDPKYRAKNASKLFYKAWDHPSTTSRTLKVITMYPRSIAAKYGLIPGHIVEHCFIELFGGFDPNAKMRDEYSVLPHALIEAFRPFTNLPDLANGRRVMQEALQVEGCNVQPPLVTHAYGKTCRILGTMVSPDGFDTCYKTVNAEYIAFQVATGWEIRCSAAQQAEMIAKGAQPKSVGERGTSCRVNLKMVKHDLDHNEHFANLPSGIDAHDFEYARKLTILATWKNQKTGNNESMYVRATDSHQNKPLKRAMFALSMYEWSAGILLREIPEGPRRMNLLAAIAADRTPGKVWQRADACVVKCPGILGEHACTMSFTSNSALSEHLVSSKACAAVEELLPREIKKTYRCFYKCVSCSQTYNAFTGVVYHVERTDECMAVYDTIDGGLVAANCYNIPPPLPSSLGTNVVHYDIRCPGCMKRYTQAGNLNPHFRKSPKCKAAEAQIDEPLRTNYKRNLCCLKCGDLFMSIKSVMRHIARSVECGKHYDQTVGVPTWENSRFAPPQLPPPSEDESEEDESEEDESD